MTTIKDVAREAGVSTATVSRALMQPEMVSPEFRRKVGEAVARTGYTPNRAARSLRSRRTRVVVVVVPDISNPFFSEIIRGMSQVSRSAGYSLLLGDTENDPNKEDEFAELFLAQQVDGMILLNGRLPRLPVGAGQPSFQAMPPLVMACEYQMEVPVPTVRLDNVGAARLAMGYLLDGGHRDIGFITGPMWNVLGRDRLQGYRDSLLDAGLAYRPELVAEGDFSIASGTSATQRLLAAETRPTALFCSNDEMAIGAIRAARLAGMRVPDDLSVVGFDDIQFASAYDPPLTTVSQPRLEIGRRAMALLLESLEQRKTEPRLEVLKGELVIRESSRKLRP